MGIFKKKPTYNVKAEVQIVMKSGVVLTTEFQSTGLKKPEYFDEEIMELLNSNGYFRIKDPASEFKTLIPIQNIDRLLYNPKVTEIKAGEE